MEDTGNSMSMLLRFFFTEEAMAKRQYGNEISKRDPALTGASSPPGALTDSTCLHAVDCVGHLSGPCSP